MACEPAGFHALEALRLRAPDGASAIVTLNGAQTVSWIPAGGVEQLFVSDRSDFEAGRPVRGGVPVVFPQFSDRGPLPKHGLVRTRAWRLLREATSAEGATATFAIEDCAETRRLWPHSFALELTVAIAGPSLEVRLLVRNTGEAPFPFTAALHTYLFASDAAKARLVGLSGVRYLRGREEHVEAGESIVAANPIDHVYIDAPRETRLVDGDRTLAIAQRNFRDTVVWNPGREKCAALVDMAPGAFLNMLCVEAAAVAVPIALPPGAQWTGAQRLAVA